MITNDIYEKSHLFSLYKLMGYIFLLPRKKNRSKQLTDETIYWEITISVGNYMTFIVAGTMAAEKSGR